MLEGAPLQCQFFYHDKSLSDFKHSQRSLKFFAELTLLTSITNTVQNKRNIQIPSSSLAFVYPTGANLLAREIFTSLARSFCKLSLTITYNIYEKLKSQLVIHISYLWGLASSRQLGLGHQYQYCQLVSKFHTVNLMNDELKEFKKFPHLFCQETSFTKLTLFINYF